MIDVFTQQKRDITNAVLEQLKQGRVVILSGKQSVVSEIYHSNRDNFNTMYLEDGSTAFYLKSELLNSDHL